MDNPDYSSEYINWLLSNRLGHWHYDSWFQAVTQMPDTVERLLVNTYNVAPFAGERSNHAPDGAGDYDGKS